MTLSDIFDYARDLSKVTASQYSNDKLLTWAKVWIKKIQREVASIRQDYFGEVSLETGVINQEDYPLPDNCLTFRRLEVCYNADKSQSKQVWTPAKEIDIPSLPNSWDYYEKNTPKSAPIYDLINHRIYVAPIRSTQIDSGDVIKFRLYYIARPDDPTQTTDKPLLTSTDVSLADYQPLISYGLTFDILTSIGSVRAPEFYQRYIGGIEKMKNQIRQQNTGRVIANHPYNDGSQY